MAAAISLLSFRDTRLHVDPESRVVRGTGFRVCAQEGASRNDELGPLDPGFRGEIDGAVPADVVEMPIEEFSRCALAGAVQQFEEVVIGFHLAGSGETGAER